MTNPTTTMQCRLRWRSTATNKVGSSCQQWSH